MEQKSIAIKWSMFSLAQAFKAEAEKIGWRYNNSFSNFIDSPAYDCLYFTTGWHTAPDECLFALSNAGRGAEEYNLPEDWNKALRAIDDYKSNCPDALKGETIKFAETLTASVTHKKLIIGCMEVSKESFLTLVNRAIVADFIRYNDIRYNDIDEIPY